MNSPSDPPDDPDRVRGLYGKFEVRRVDGSSEPGGKHRDCRYFVLDVDHDAFAQAALSAYAHECQLTHPQLAEDLRAHYLEDAPPVDPLEALTGAAVRALRARRYPAVVTSAEVTSGGDPAVYVVTAARIVGDAAIAKEMARAFAEVFIGPDAELAAATDEQGQEYPS